MFAEERHVLDIADLDSVAIDLDILFYLVENQQPKHNLQIFEQIILYTEDRVGNGQVPKTEDITQFECPICIEIHPTQNAVTPNCLHNVCNTCIFQHLDSFKTRKDPPSCSLCRSPYTCLKIVDKTAFNAIGELIRGQTYCTLPCTLYDVHGLHTA